MARNSVTSEWSRKKKKKKEGKTKIAMTHSQTNFEASPTDYVSSIGMTHIEPKQQCIPRTGYVCRANQHPVHFNCLLRNACPLKDTVGCTWFTVKEVYNIRNDVDTMVYLNCSCV